MPSLTVSMDKKLKQRMDQFDEINWSAVARNAFQDKVKQMETLYQELEEQGLH